VKWAFALLCLTLLAPLTLVDVPPLLDYPNHLARAVVLASAGTDPILSSMYRPHWAIIPDLGIDLVLPPLLHMLPIHWAGRIVVGLTLLLPVVGAVAYSRSNFGVWSAWPLASALVAYNATFLLGFLNFVAGIGMALLFGAAWIAWRDRYPKLVAIIANVGTIALFFCHLMGLLFFCVLIVYAWSNAVNFTDGLDGLAAGAMAMVCAAYVIITFWQFRNACATAPGVGCYNVRDPLDLALIAAATAGACVGFLWWNAAPAKIFMGDTGSLALGGVIAALSVLSRTEMLAVVLGALFVAEVTSVVVQILAFRTTGRRVFRMAPFHHHFELVGWAETTVIIRFWLLTAIACGLGVALFYSEWLTTVGA